MTKHCLNLASPPNIHQMELPWAEPYKVKMVEEFFMSTREQRERWIEEENYNLFNRVFVDLLTDSGTGSMSDKTMGGNHVG